MDFADLHSLDPSYRLNVSFLSTDDSRARTDKIWNTLKDDPFVSRLQQLAWLQYEKIYNSEKRVNGTSNDVNTQVMNLLEETGLKELLASTTSRIYERSSSLFTTNSIYDSSPSYARYAADESVECVREVRVSWEEGINEELKSISHERKRPFATVRPPGATNALLIENAPPPADREDVRFLFDSQDLLDTVVSIRSANASAAALARTVGLIKVSLAVPSFDDLRLRYAEVGPAYSQLGVDELSSRAGAGAGFCTARHEEAEALLSGTSGGTVSMVAARKFLRRGAPTSLRGKLWRVALGLSVKTSPSEESVYETLRRNCDRLDLLTDELYVMDVYHAADDERYFVFEEELRHVALCFSRDAWILQNADYVIHKPLTSPPVEGSETAMACPPCGVQPFLGLASYFAPLCYLYKEPASLYSVSRLMYARLWSHMNVISSDAGTLLHVCCTFESLLASVHLRLFLHLLSLGVQPLQIALPWLQLGFVGTLEVDQILLLWDRVIGYMDTTVLAALAVAIFVFRAEPLLQCTTATEATSLLHEDSRLNVAVLLQLLFFF